MGIAGLPRPDGPLIWFHAASVGEAASLLELLRRLTQARPGLTCLVTTGTVTSARFLVDRLPRTASTGSSPLDVLPWVRRFLDHWRPDAAVFTERVLARDALRGLRPRHPAAAHQRPHLESQLPALADARRHGAGAPRALRPHPRAGHPRRRAARRPRGRSRPAHRRGIAQEGGGAAPLRRRPSGRKWRAPSRAGTSGSPPRPTQARRRSCWARTSARGRPCRFSPSCSSRAGDEVAALVRSRGLTVAQRSKGEPRHRRHRGLPRRHAGRDGPLVPHRPGQLRRRVAHRRRRPQPRSSRRFSAAPSVRPTRAQFHRRLSPAPSLRARRSSFATRRS